MNKRFLIGLVTASSLSVLATAALADPPARVGRVSYAAGEVSFQPVDADFWAPAQRNLPVTTGEAFWTGDGGRLELQLAGIEARADRQTELDVTALDYGETRIGLPQGSVDLRVWATPRGPITFVTPAGEVTIDQPGMYRIDAQPAGEGGDYGPVVVTVFQGQAEAPGPDGPVSVQDGQSVSVLPGYDPDYEYAQETGIDQWARQRDAREEAWRRRDEWGEMTGGSDLDEYGDWSEDAQYGRVWFPRDVGPDWAPYRDGRWAYVQPWGWTWVDDSPWGFAPFHYGRWARFGGRWGWVPGRIEREPVYAPALVAFIGGNGWGVSIGIGDSMGWVPLAPDEAYIPSYRVSGDYVRRVNTGHVSPTIINQIVVNNTTINNTVVINKTVVQYRNAQAATVVRAADFSKGAPVKTAAVKVDPTVLARTTTAAPATALARVQPTREARAGAPVTAGGTASAPPSAPPPPPKLQVLRQAVKSAPVGHAGPPPEIRALKPAVQSTTPTGKTLQPHTAGSQPTGQVAPTARTAPTGVSPDMRRRAPTGSLPPPPNAGQGRPQFETERGRPLTPPPPPPPAPMPPNQLQRRTYTPPPAPPPTPEQQRMYERRTGQPMAPTPEAGGRTPPERRVVSPPPPPPPVVERRVVSPPPPPPAVVERRAPPAPPPPPKKKPVPDSSKPKKPDSDNEPKL